MPETEPPRSRRNTITNLTSQDEQAECFLTGAAQLEPGGYTSRAQIVRL